LIDLPYLSHPKFYINNSRSSVQEIQFPPSRAVPIIEVITADERETLSPFKPVNFVKKSEHLDSSKKIQLLKKKTSVGKFHDAIDEISGSDSPKITNNRAIESYHRFSQQNVQFLTNLTQVEHPEPSVFPKEFTELKSKPDQRHPRRNYPTGPSPMTYPMSFEPTPPKPHPAHAHAHSHAHAHIHSHAHAHIHSHAHTQPREYERTSTESGEQRFTDHPPTPPSQPPKPPYQNPPTQNNPKPPQRFSDPPTQNPNPDVVEYTDTINVNKIYRNSMSSLSEGVYEGTGYGRG
jgi:hypothetical protein